ncbi:MAG: hypothetical protein K0S37_4752 [Microbacterium sp.]|nr:hypothetical protein [Microbacterium sp.]
MCNSDRNVPQVAVPNHEPVEDAGGRKTQMSKWMSVRRGALAAVVAVGMVSVAACSGGGGGGAGPDSSSATEGDLIWWGWTPDKPVADQLIAKFNEEYPDIAVEFVSKPIDTYDSLIGPAITSSEGPDIFNLAPGSANGGVGVFHAGAMDLGPVVEEALGEDWQDQLAATGVEGLTVDGKVAALSAGAVYSGGLWINKDIFDQHGLTAPTTMAEWQSVCETLEAAGQGCFIQGAGQNGFNMDTFEAIMENVEPGAYVAASQDEKSYTDPEFVEGLEIWKSLFDDGIMQEGAVGLQQYPEANNAFMKGEYAMIMMGSWYTQYTVRDIMTGAMSAAGVADPEPFTMVPIPFPDLAGTGNVGSMFGEVRPAGCCGDLRAVADHLGGGAAGCREHAQRHPVPRRDPARMGLDRARRPRGSAVAPDRLHRAGERVHPAAVRDREPRPQRGVRRRPDRRRERIDVRRRGS